MPGWDFSGPTPETVYLPPGKYNVVVDVDHNMNYDEDYDMVSSFYIKSDFVIPEYPYGTFLSILTMIAALSIVKARKGPLGKF